MPLIRIEHLKKEFPNTTPLKDVSVVINDGDVISVIGPSGTGKSTLLRCINRLEEPSDGHILIDNDEITAPKCNINQIRRKMGMVFQGFNLFEHLTVIENIMLPPMDLLGMPKQEAYNEAMRLLRMVGLAEKALNYPDELSGGQKQRIAIARTVRHEPAGDTVRRADQCPRSHNGGRGSGCNPRIGKYREDADDRNA